MVIASDSQASGGRFVQVPQGRGDNYNDTSFGGPGEVRFTISIPSSGTRALWARVQAPDGLSNSSYVTMNGKLVSEWHVPESTAWKWNKVTNVSLSAGTVNLSFRQREDGMKLDQIILASDLNFTPGQSAQALALATGKSSGPALSVNVVKSLTKNGSGDGTVTTEPAGIHCGRACQKRFRPGTVVKLIANPADGKSFGGWSGDAACSSGVITLTSNITCTATFHAQTLGLHLTKTGSGTGTVLSTPSGIDCGSDCSEAFRDGATITLTAKAARGSTFKGWSGGGCSGTSKCAIVVSGSTSVTALFETHEEEHPIAAVGIYRPSTGDIFLDRNGNGEWEGCTTDICMKWLAQKSGKPVAGDWEGNGTVRIGTFDSASGAWYLDRNGNGRWDGCTVDICIDSLGAPGDIPVLGSSGATRPRLGVYRAKGGLWQFDANGNNAFDNCQVDACYAKFGAPGVFGLAGDWDGDGNSEIATFEPQTGFWFVDYNDSGVRNSCAVDKCYSGFGEIDDLPVAGDWDGDGRTKIGVFRPSTGQWFLDKNGNGRLDNCHVDICISAFGQPGDQPLVGKWLGLGAPWSATGPLLNTAK
jgi:hypothetical protein